MIKKNNSLKNLLYNKLSMPCVVLSIQQAGNVCGVGRGGGEQCMLHNSVASLTCSCFSM